MPKEAKRELKSKFVSGFYAEPKRWARWRKAWRKEQQKAPDYSWSDFAREAFDSLAEDIEASE